MIHWITLFECVAPAQGIEHNELCDVWFWDGGTALLNETVFNSAIGDLSLRRAPGVDDITPSMLQKEKKIGYFST